MIDSITIDGSELVHLSELPGNTDGPAETVAADEEGLHSPTPKMAEGKNVKVAQDSLPGDDVAVHSIFLQAEAPRGSLTTLDRSPTPSGARLSSLTIISASRLA